MTGLNQEFKKNGFVVCDMTTQTESLMNECRDLVHHYFSCETEYYAGLGRSEFHKISYECQLAINSINFQKRFLLLEQNNIEQLIDYKSLFHESVIFLRSVRPNLLDDHGRKSKSAEYLGIHRETMYSDNPEQISRAINLWIPLENCTENSTLCFIPNSHQIQDQELNWIASYNDPRNVEKGSIGHKLGNLYLNKEITSGFNPDTLRRFAHNKNQYILFSPLLLHGGSLNTTSSIRQSLSMALINESNISFNKKYTAANGMPHYTSFNIK